MWENTEGVTTQCKDTANLLWVLKLTVPSRV